MDALMQRSMCARLEAALSVGARCSAVQQAAVHSVVPRGSRRRRTPLKSKSVAFFVQVGPKMQRTKWVKTQQKGLNQRQRREVQRP